MILRSTQHRPWPRQCSIKVLLPSTGTGKPSVTLHTQELQRRMWALSEHHVVPGTAQVPSRVSQRGACAP